MEANLLVEATETRRSTFVTASSSLVEVLIRLDFYTNADARSSKRATRKALPRIFARGLINEFFGNYQFLLQITTFGLDFFGDRVLVFLQNWDVPCC
jgi:hypothetical protein